MRSEVTVRNRTELSIAMRHNALLCTYVCSRRRVLGGLPTAGVREKGRKRHLVLVRIARLGADALTCKGWEDDKMAK
jgi:hypothetical protein